MKQETTAQERLDRIRRELSAKYNLDLDRDLIPLMAEIMESRDDFGQRVGRIERTVEAAALLLHKHSLPRAVSQQLFKDNRQAFWHGFGKLGAALSIGVLLAFVSFLLVFTRQENQAEADSIARYVQEHRQIRSFEVLSGYAKVKRMDLEGRTLQYIELAPRMDFKKARVGIDAVIDVKKKSVIIPLMFTDK